MRYPISGSVVMWPGGASSGADNASTGAVLLAHGTATSTLASRGRVFWLRSLWANATASGFSLALSDASVSATGVSATAAPAVYYPRLFSLNVASSIIGGLQTATQSQGEAPGSRFVTFPAPGLKFSTNCVVFLLDASGATYGTMGGAGYEE